MEKFQNSEKIKKGIHGGELIHACKLREAGVVHQSEVSLGYILRPCCKKPHPPMSFKIIPSKISIV